MEAMCYGFPLILSDIGPLKEIAETNAIYCNPESPKDIADKILYAHKNWDDFLSISKNNKTWASERFSKEKYLTKLNSIYSKIL